MLTCYAQGCSNRSSTSSEITFHRLLSKSKRPSIRKKWLANIKRRGQLPKEEHFAICSQHYEEDCFEKDLKVLIVFIQSDRRVFLILVLHEEKITLSL